MVPNLTEVRFALRDQLKRDTRFKGVKIESDKEINSNPDRTPWIGIMGDVAEYTPHAMSWKVEPDIMIYCQASNIRSPDEAAIRAGGLAADVIDNLKASTFQVKRENGTALAFVRVIKAETGYPLDKSMGDEWFRGEILYLSLEARA